ncbi:MAG: hypothetical protein WCD76_01320 [Pyrinomonadaceae bacterium]
MKINIRAIAVLVMILSVISLNYGMVQTKQARIPYRKPSVTSPRISWELLKAEGFTILMPGKAIKSTSKIETKLGIMTMTVFSVNSHKESFTATYQDFPPSQWDFNGSGLGGVSKGYLRMGGSILSEQDIFVSNYPAKEITFTDKDGYFYKSVTIQVEPRLYQIMYMNKLGRFTSIEAAHFFSSFTLDKAFASVNMEKRLEYDAKNLTEKLSAEFPYYPKAAITLLGKEIMKRHLNPDQAGRFGLEIMTKGVSKLTNDEQQELYRLRSEMFSALSNDETDIYNSLYNKAVSSSLTKEEKLYANLLIKKAFDSLSPPDKLHFQSLLEQSLKIALSTR